VEGGFEFRLEDCPNCEGTGVIQSGSLEGSYCRKCENGKILSDDGKTLLALFLYEIKRENS
jgi:hypothetical protein